ncbi:uncharacterized protein [Physcomitrium patens]|uniref:Transmembrane protein 45B n=1 Tax=Physcomitrium patens TaxID=3218 RepID=A9SC00_PHYPA|nr:transmembrane protein 45A-like [Physcomitrium patens]PNR53752.1 hypothetical protein PHYPA_007427 [Physcomitrium patens]|eukprot:XP_024377077.1 transmembrane protein 45A-like [Physcomitrella patens]
MGSFKGHVLPGSMFLLVGLWHTLNSITNYVENPKAFRARVWHPVRCFSGKTRCLELYILLVGTFTDMCIEFFYSTHLKFTVNGAINTNHLNDFEHAAMLLMFFLFVIVVLISENTRWLPLPEGSLFVVAAMAFTAEFLLFYFHSTNHHGLEGRYHEILVLLIGLCIVCALLSAAYPENFAADMLSGIALTLQGAWFYMIAFTLYGPLMPDGCSDVRDEIVCIGDSFEVRGEAVAHIQLAALVPCLWVLILVAYGLAAHFWGHPDVFHPPSSEITDFRSGPLDSPMSAEH